MQPDFNTGKGNSPAAGIKKTATFIFENLFMRSLYKIGLAAGLCCLLSASLIAQKSLTCADVHQGMFYNYPRDTSSRYADFYEGGYLHETNLATGDTSLWKLTWKDECTYTLSLVDLNGENELRTRRLMKKHRLAFTIDHLASDYYTFTSYLDKPGSVLLMTDTMWLHEKANAAASYLVEAVPGSEANRAFPISDTSKYALLYVYRPGKITMSLDNYLLYFDGNLVGVAKNNSGLLFKVLKEGEFRFSSRIYKAESSLPLTIRFGNTYYVKTYLEWRLYKSVNDYKLRNEVMSAEQGRADFSNIRRF